MISLTTMAVLGGLLTATGQGAVATSEPGESATRIHVVRPGESLWQIAREVPGVDPRETVERIMDLNGMGSAEVVAGRALVIPA